MPYPVFSEQHKSKDELTPSERAWLMPKVKPHEEEVTQDGTDNQGVDQGAKEEQKKLDEQKRHKEHWCSLQNNARDLERLTNTHYRDDVVHGCPTLDESYYHFLPEDTNAQKDREYRNRTQIVTKGIAEALNQRNSRESGTTKSKGNKDDEKLAELPYWTILRINQLWIWVVGQSK